jgi:tetratricopeptide (TPR) repeat protein
VAAAFELSWTELNPPARTLGCLLSVFALAAIPWELVAKCLPDWDEEDLEDCRDDELLEQSLLSLVEDETSDSGQSGLVQPRYQLHALIREFFAAKLQGRADAEILRSNFAVVLTAVAKTIPSPVTQEVQERVKEALPHLVVVAEQWSHLLEDSTDATWSFTSLARVAQEQSLWVEADKWYKACLQMTEKRCGADHPDTALSLNNLAGLYNAMGRYPEAEPLLVRSLSICEQQLGADHPLMAGSLNNLAGLYNAMERYPEAEPLYVRSLAIHEQQLGADHPDTALSLNNLGGLYKEMGRYEKAEPLLMRALSIRKQQLGVNHPDMAPSLNNLGGLYVEMGRYEEAELLLVQSLSICQQQLGADHPNTALNLNNLANLYHVMGRYPEAERLYLQALAIFLNTLADNHPNTQSVWSNFIDFLQQAISTGQDSQLSQHPTTQAMLQQLRETE